MPASVTSDRISIVLPSSLQGPHTAGDFAKDGGRSDWCRLLVAVSELADSAWLERFWNEPDRLVEENVALKRGNRCTVSLLEENCKQFVIKRYNLRSPRHTALHCWQTSRARMAWIQGYRLMAAGVPAPQPLAILEERRGPLRFRSYLIYEYLPGELLWHQIRDFPLSKEETDRLVQAFGILWRKLEAARCYHGDLKGINVVVGKKELSVIDLDATKFFRSERAFRRSQRRDAARFLQNWKDLPQLQRQFAQEMGFE
ncbi:Hypothetical protein PBC10988_0060 [Planctomycetales bacterium 10988]|nr:Hypothetical protein PBC10988_0060 [Planctomycetales bacterium 10988]